MLDAVGFFLPIAEALVGGYLAMAAVYMFALFVITRLKRNLLMQEARPSTIYNLLHMLAWGLCAAAGAYVCCGLSPLAPYGTIGFPLLLCAIIIYVAARAFRQLPGQMSVAIFSANLSMIVLGTLGALIAHHALPIRS